MTLDILNILTHVVPLCGRGNIYHVMASFGIWNESLKTDMEMVLYDAAPTMPTLIWNGQTSMVLATTPYYKQIGIMDCHT